MSTAVIRPRVRRSPTEYPGPVRLVSYWHLLSLDAPSVAVAWLLLLNRGVPQGTLTVEALALALAVWMIYVADRLLDARHEAGRLQQRHRFHQRHRRQFVCTLVVLSPVLVLMVVALPTHLRGVWLSLGVPLALYAACIHLFRKRLPKEFVVGAIFAAVIVAPSSGERTWSHIAPAAFLLFVLCWWNCLLITRWEAGADSGGVAAAMPLRLRAVPLLLTLAAMLCLLSPTARPAGIAGILSGALLMGLHRNRHRFGPVLLRSLADAALLTPLLVMPFLHWSR